MDRKRLWKRVALAILALALVGGMAWYSRPVDVYGLLPGLQPTYLGISLNDWSNFDDPKEHRLDTEAGDPLYPELRETLEALRFRRIPLGRLWNWIDSRTGETVYGDYRGILGITDGRRYLTLEYQDDWSYVTVIEGGAGPISRNVTLVGGEEATQALTRDLLAIAARQS